MRVQVTQWILHDVAMRTPDRMVLRVGTRRTNGGAVRAVVRSMFSPDVEVRGYVPRDPENDGVLLRVYAGPADGPGEESFDVLVCTPAWLKARVRSHGPQVGRHHLIIDPMDLGLAMRFLKHRFEMVEGASWHEMGPKLARLGYWEFEDYEP